MAGKRAVMSADELAALHVSYAATGDRVLRNRLAETYDAYAVSLARRFPSRREALEDLVQVARMGLVLAVERFDPGRGQPFTAFARATIEGVLKRHIRDRTWPLRVPRALQEHYLVVVRTVDDLTQELGRSPRVAEIAARTGLSLDEVVEAMDLMANQWPASLDGPRQDGGRASPEPAATEGSFTRIEDDSVLASLLRRLPEREAQVLHLRFIEGLTQAQIGTRLGMSQMGVSRLLRRTLSQLTARAHSFGSVGSSAG